MKGNFEAEKQKLQTIVFRRGKTHKGQKNHNNFFSYWLPAVIPPYRSFLKKASERVVFRKSGTTNFIQEMEGGASMKLRQIGKKGAANASGLFMMLTIALVAVLLFKSLGGNTNVLGGTQAAGGVAGGTGGGDTVIKVEGAKPACATTTVTVDNTNALTRGTSPGEYTRIFLVNGARQDLGQFAEGGTKSLNGGDNVVAYHAENSTTASSGYYTSKKEYTLECTGATASHNDEAQLYQYDNGITLSYKNQNGEVNTAQSVAANSKYDFDVTLRTSALRSWGNPELTGNPNALCFQYNNTVFTTLDWKIGGVNQGFIPTPQVHSGNNTVSGQNAFKCFGAPVKMNTDKLEGVLHVETGSIAGLPINSINVTTEDGDYDLDADTLAEIKGLQDEDGNDLGMVGIYLRPIDITS
ncbi:MAG: hypothetical protein HY376_03035 [Candidatus Blackburnbacteria bacterium]|nr:hypothetical protein [Candidatus Blackburnbacteria bacterium]